MILGTTLSVYGGDVLCFYIHLLTKGPETVAGSFFLRKQESPSRKQLHRTRCSKTWGEEKQKDHGAEDLWNLCMGKQI
jgi:hypothetical protein